MKGRIRIVRETDAMPPEDDIVKITYMQQSRYCLGDEAVTPERAHELQQRLEAGDVIGIPVYAYVHSGSTIRCSDSGNPFSCPWDSARSGLAYVTTADAQREWGDEASAMSDIVEKAKQYIRGVVKVFDAYLRDAVFGYVAEARVVDPDSGEELDDWEEKESCWGFYGDDWKTNGISDYVEAFLDEGYEIVEE